MKQWYLAVLTFFIGSSLIAQPGSLSGRVSADSVPLAGATVEIRKLQLRTATDSTGFYRFHQLPSGNHLLHISAIGYEPVHEMVRVHPGKEQVGVYHLRPLAQSMESVVVTGTLRPVLRKESPILVEVYTPQFLKKNPVPSIFEALQQVNGVRPQLNCQVCNTGDIHINGLEGPYTMITIDGMPIVSSLASVYGLFGIPTQMIERVEIVKGPASGLYGSEAIGGLINIITKSPEKSPALSFNAMTTGWREHSLDAGVRMKLGKKAFDLLGINYYNYLHPLDHNGDNFTDITLQHRVSVFNKISWRRNQDRIASLAARYFHEDRWGGEMQWEPKFRGTDSIYGESIYTDRWELIGNYQLPLFEKMFFSFSATSHLQDSYYGTTPYYGDQKILFGQFLWHCNIQNRHEALLGLAGRYNYYDDNSTATLDTLTGANRPDRVFLPGIFLQDEWKPAPQHHLLLGLRMDYHDVHKGIFTPRFAWKWSPAGEHVVRLNAGTGFRVVNLFTEEHAALTGARKVEVQEALRPEKSYNVNLNYSTKVFGKQSSLHLDLSAWYTYFNNQILPDYLTDPNKIIYRNLEGHSVSRGGTMNLEASLGRRMKLMAGLTVQDVSKMTRNGNGAKLREEVMLTEKWSGTWSLAYVFPAEGITVDYTGKIYGPMKLPLVSALDPRRPLSPVWSLQNIQFSKKFSSVFEVYTGVKNILNWTPARNNPFIIARSHDPFDKKVEYDGSGNVLVTQENPYGLTFDPSYVYAPNQGRRFFAGLRVTLSR